MKGLSTAPSMTRGLRRQRAKMQRRREAVPPEALVVGIDLARERQAVSFLVGGDVVGRRRLSCGPQYLADVLEEAQSLALHHGASGIVAAFEPAGHYWCLAAESFERAGIPYVLVQPLSVKRAREESRYTPEKTDPRDADLIGQLAFRKGRFTDTRLPATADEDALAQLAREYFRVRKLGAAERTRLHNLWNRLLPEFYSVIRDPTGKTALAISAAMAPLSELAALSPRAWLSRVRKAANGAQILTSRAAALLPLLKSAHLDPARRSGEGIPTQIRHAAERRRLLEAQKAFLHAELVRRYHARPESTFLDSIPGANSLYSALVLALVGDFHRFDDARAIVKLAGSEVNHYASGDWQGTSRISHRGRSGLRAAAYQHARQLVVKNDEFCARFHTLIHRTTRRALPLKAAYVAVMNSYLRIAHGLVTRQEFYLPRAERTYDAVP
jgi:transposase